MTNFPAGKGTGRKLKLMETLTPTERQLKDAPYSLSVEGFVALQQRIVKDATFGADIDFQLRRPRRVSKARHGIAGRSAIREPMLNANPSQISDGLNYEERIKKDRVPKGDLYDKLVIKPKSMCAAKLNRSSAFWGERLWYIYRLKYASGFVIVTDDDSESRVFPTYGELKAAIVKSGWEIVR